MKAMQIISVVIFLCLRLPIWYYLMYFVLQACHADRLVMFLFWVYLPIGIFEGIIDSIIKVNTP